MPGTGSFEHALKNAAILCSKSEKCSADIISDLKRWGLTEEQIEKALEYLKKEKYVDDQRFAFHFVNDKFRLNKWGKVKIAFMLRQKHISEQIIENSFTGIQEEDYERILRETLQAKVKSVKGSSLYERKGKLSSFAMSRGFESEIAFRIAGEILGSS